MEKELKHIMEKNKEIKIDGKIEKSKFMLSHISPINQNKNIKTESYKRNYSSENLNIQNTYNIDEQNLMH